MYYNSFDLIKKLSFIRTGGSKEEKKAAKLLVKECKKLNVDATIEPFEVDGYKVNDVKLSFSSKNLNIECCGVGLACNSDNFKGKFTYVSSVKDATIQDIEDKVCLLDTKIVNVDLYKVLLKKKVGALILCCGNVYDDNDKVDLDPYMLREIHLKEGSVPTVCIRMKDAEKVLRVNPEYACISINQDTFKNNSHNVIASIKGSKNTKETIVFTAHYDSVSYSTGSYDNATGSATIMQLLAYFSINQPQRNLKFIWCGSEEMGLLGSKAYCKMHQSELEDIVLCINVDMTGVLLGHDIACCSSDNSLVNFINYLGCEVGFAIDAYQGVYSSDSSPFADCGVPSVSFARLSPRGGAEIHSRKDVMDHLHPENYYKTCDFIIKFSERLINSVSFPVEKEIPSDIKNKLDVYFKRVPAKK